MSIDNTTDQRRKRPVVIKLALAAVAVLGVGAAFTSAAWTDNAWFTANASSATVALQGRVVGDTTWQDADTEGAAVTIDAAELDGLLPGETRSVQVELQNTGSVPLSVGAPAITAEDGVFAGTAPATVTTDWNAGVIAPGASSAAVTVTVVTPEEWPADYQGQTGTVTLVFQGTTDLP